MQFLDHARDLWIGLTRGYQTVAMSEDNALDDSNRSVVEVGACGVMVTTATLVPVTCLPTLALGGYLEP